MDHIFYFGMLLWISFSFAQVELAVEGGDGGWAKKLPTWKHDTNHWMSKYLFGGRPATGYHLWLHIFIFSALHFIFLFQGFTWNTELKVIAFWLLFWVLEDFLWFLINPKFGIKNFRKQKIWWHEKNWFLVAPLEYFIFLPLGLYLYWFSVM